MSKHNRRPKQGSSRATSPQTHRGTPASRVASDSYGLMSQPSTPQLPWARTAPVGRYKLRPLSTPTVRPPRAYTKYRLDKLYWPDQPLPYLKPAKPLLERLTTCAKRYIKRRLVFATGFGGVKTRIFKRRYSNQRC
ncbi:hypothetical protein [robinz microvirus RP_175]|nr:hypothetical protein [robinz microvirus RP_175]